MKVKCTKEIFNTVVSEFVVSQHIGYSPECQGECWVEIRDGVAIRTYSVEPDEQILPWTDEVDIRRVEDFFDKRECYDWGECICCFLDEDDECCCDKGEEAAIQHAAYNCLLEVIED